MHGWAGESCRNGAVGLIIASATALGSAAMADPDFGVVDLSRPDFTDVESGFVTLTHKLATAVAVKQSIEIFGSPDKQGGR
jgi:hypothetical protein